MGICRIGFRQVLCQGDAVRWWRDPDCCFDKSCRSNCKSIRRDQIESEFGQLVSTVSPSKAKITIAKAMFADVWDMHLRQVMEQAAHLTNQIKKVDKQIDRLPDCNMAETKPVIMALAVVACGQVSFFLIRCMRELFIATCCNPLPSDAQF